MIGWPEKCWRRSESRRKRRNVRYRPPGQKGKDPCRSPRGCLQKNRGGPAEAEQRIREREAQAEAEAEQKIRAMNRKTERRLEEIRAYAEKRKEEAAGLILEKLFGTEKEIP